MDTPRPFQDLTDSIAFVERHFSSTPSASDAFAQAAVRTAEWAKRQASKVQLSEVISGWSAPSSLKPPWPVPDFPSPFGQERGADANKDKADADRAAKDRAGKVCLRARWAGAAPRARVAVAAPLTFWAGVLTPAREGGSGCAVGTRVGATVGKGGGGDPMPKGSAT